MFSIILKLTLVLAGVLGLFFIAGVTGILFFFWPVAYGDHSLNITPQTLSELKLLEQEMKFLEDLPNHYPGAPDEPIRMNAQESVNVLVHTLIAELPSNPQRSFVLRTMKSTLASFINQDTEEREQMLRYCERVLAILGINNSGELFNVWLYGFPYRWFWHE